MLFAFSHFLLFYLPLLCFFQWYNQLNSHLSETDPELFDIIEKEKQRQYKSIQLIPSENFTSRSVLEALGSVMQNKYSEGYPGARYYGGNEFIDMSERLCQKRALEAFHLKDTEWGVNVQPLSGSPANFYAYTAVLKPHDRILSMDLPHGGHLSHGYQTPTKKISAVSIYFETMGYRLNEKTGLIDYDQLEMLADFYRPKLIVAGASAYPQLIDYARFKKIAQKHNAYLLADIAHISGLIAAETIPSPFEYADIVTTTTHKSLRGPRGAMIFYRKGVKQMDKQGNAINYDLEEKVNSSVFPGSQGGPHNHTITALATCLKQATSQEFKEYQQQVLANSKALANRLSQKHQYKLVSNGTSNHLMLLDLNPNDMDGARVERVLELANIALNKNTVPGDKSAMVPGGIRMGSPAMTSRGLLEKDFEQIGEFIHQGISIASKLKQDLAKQDKKKVSDFKDFLVQEPMSYGIKELRKQVEEFSVQFKPIGFTVDEMKYK